MRYSLGIDLGGATARVAAASGDGRVHDVGEVPLVVGLTPGGGVVVGSGALTLEDSRRASGFRDRLGQPDPVLIGGTPFGIEALIAQVLRSTVDTVASDAGDWPVRIAVAYPDEWSDYHLDLLWQAAAMAEVGDVVLLTETEARAVASDEPTTEFAIARGAARWARPEDESPPVEPAGLPISGRTTASVLAALAGGAALGVAGAAATAGAAGAGAASRIADFGQGGRTMADWARGTETMADYAQSGSRMSDFGEGRSMSDFGGGGPQPPGGGPVSTAVKAGRRVPRAALLGGAVAAVAVVAVAGIALASRSGDDGTKVATSVPSTTAVQATTTTATAGGDGAESEIPFLFAGGGTERGDDLAAEQVRFDAGVVGVDVAGDGRVFMLDRSGGVWASDVGGATFDLLFEGELNGAVASEPADLVLLENAEDALLFIADPRNNRVVSIDLNSGDVSQIGVTGEPSDDAVPSASVGSVRLSQPVSLDVGAGADLFIADAGQNSILRVGLDGSVEALAGAGADEFPEEGAPAADTHFTSLTAVAVADDGTPFIATDRRIWQIEDGLVRRVAGDGEFPGTSFEEGPALDSRVDPVDLAFSPEGLLHIASSNVSSDILRVAGSGTLERVAGGLAPSPSLPPTATRFSPDALAFDESGRIYVGESGTSYEIVRRLPPDGIPDDAATFRFSDDDRVGAGDDAAQADGQPDNVFEVSLDGEIADLIVSACGADDEPSSSHWDTFTGDDPIPSEFSWDEGSQTWILGVLANSSGILNDEDGDLPLLELDEPTPVFLYMQNDGSIRPGARLCVYVFRPDGSREVQGFTVFGFDG